MTHHPVTTYQLERFHTMGIRPVTQGEVDNYFGGIWPVTPKADCYNVTCEDYYNPHKKHYIPSADDYYNDLPDLDSSSLSENEDDM